MVNPDRVASYTTRFVGVPPYLSGVQEIGYLGQIAVDNTHPEREGTQQFYMAQFALAPVAVEDCLSEPIVLGNFADDRAAATEVGRRRMRVIHELGNGVVLLRGTSGAGDTR